MKISSCFFVGIVIATLSQASLAQTQEHRPDHYKGEPSATAEQAVTNFSEYNNRLATILAKDALTPKDMNDIHQLTYTLENALEKMREELASLAEVLEEVHVASETVETETVKTRGKTYLDSARKIVK